MNTRARDQLTIPNMDEWKTGEVLAVYDLCQSISCALMTRYQDELLDQMMAIDQHREHQEHEDSEQETNLTLPFDDTL